MALGAIIVLGTVAGVIYFEFATTPAETGHEGLVLHWHVQLKIDDLRRPVSSQSLTIPDNIGRPGGFWANHTLDMYGGTFSPLHTHDNSGTIHIELTSLPHKALTLGDLFNIWGVPLTTTCVWNYCSPDQGPPPFMGTKRNGNMEICIDRSYHLLDGDEITILFGDTPFSPLECG